MASEDGPLKLVPRPAYDMYQNEPTGGLGEQTISWTTRASPFDCYAGDLDEFRGALINREIDGDGGGLFA